MVGATDLGGYRLNSYVFRESPWGHLWVLSIVRFLRSFREGVEALPYGWCDRSCWKSFEQLDVS